MVKFCSSCAEESADFPHNSAVSQVFHEVGYTDQNETRGDEEAAIGPYCYDSRKEPRVFPTSGYDFGDVQYHKYCA